MQRLVKPFLSYLALDDFDHAIGRNAACFTKFIENHLQVRKRNLVRCSNIVQDAFKAFQWDSFSRLVLGGTYHILFETRRHFLCITEVRRRVKRERCVSTLVNMSLFTRLYQRMAELTWRCGILQRLPEAFEQPSFLGQKGHDEIGHPSWWIQGYE